MLLGGLNFYELIFVCSCSQQNLFLVFINLKIGQLILKQFCKHETPLALLEGLLKIFDVQYVFAVLW